MPDQVFGEITQAQVALRMLELALLRGDLQEGRRLAGEASWLAASVENLVDA